MILPRLFAAVLVLLLAFAYVAPREWAAPTPTPASAPIPAATVAAAFAKEPLVAVQERAAARWLRQADHKDTAGPAPAATTLPPVGVRRAEATWETAFPPRATAPRWEAARAPPVRVS